MIAPGGRGRGRGGDRGDNRRDPRDELRDAVLGGGAGDPAWARPLAAASALVIGALILAGVGVWFADAAAGPADAPGLGPVVPLLAVAGLAAVAVGVVLGVAELRAARQRARLGDAPLPAARLVRERTRAR